MKIAVVGGRDFTDYDYLENTLNDFIDFHLDPGEEVIIVSGGAPGADSLAEDYAEQYRFDSEIHEPDWELHGNAAGIIRNTKIVDACDTLVAFWDGKSTGTHDSIKKAQKKGIPVIIKKYNK